MDAESIAQVEAVVTRAVKGLREEMAGLRAELREEIAGSTTALREEMATTTAELRHEMASLKDFTMMTAEDTKRHIGVLVEGVRHDLQLVAETLQTHIERQAVEHEYLEQQFRETRALIRLSYDQLHQRVEGLERRIQVIEQHLGLSAT